MKVSKRLNASGQSMIEFAIMLPFLFFLLLAIFEWGQIFVKHMRVSTLCRETAVAASQSCKDIAPAAQGETMQECVNRIQEEMTRKAIYALPNFEERGFIIVSLRGANEVISPASENFPSRYAEENMDPEVTALLGTVAMCEFFYDNALQTPMELLVDFVMPRMIYKTAYA